MDRNEYFAYLMDVIDRWVEENPGEYMGPFRYLRKEASIKSIAITPNCSIHKEDLKTFLATEILEIYRWYDKSKISYINIQKTLAGKTAKKYDFHFEKLEECLSEEANKRVARKSYVHEYSREWLQMPENIMITMYLLERLQEEARIKLGEYWSMCALDYDTSLINPEKRIRWKHKTVEKKPLDEIFLDQKYNKYMECLVTVALHEIFTREYIQNSQTTEFNEWRNKIKLLQKELESFSEKLIQKISQEDDTELEVFEKRSREIVNEVLDYLNFLKAHIFDVGLRLEHMVGVIAELQLIMFLETKNLEMIQKDQGMGKDLSKYLKCLDERDIDGFVRYDKNRNKYYKMLREDMNDIFFQYMEDITNESTKENLSQAVDTYFSIVENMKQHESDEVKQKEKIKELWKAQVILVKPIWYWEGKFRI